MSYSQSINSGATWLSLRQPESMPRTVTGSDDLATWLAEGWYEDAVEDYPIGTNPLLESVPDYSTVPTLIGNSAVWPVTVLTGQDARNSFTANINSQVPNPSQQDVINDPKLENEVFKYLAAATEKTLDLQDTLDANLNAFDTTINADNGQGASTAYSRFTVTITEQDPWVGAPNNIYGWHCELTVASGSEGTGSEGRLLIVDDPSPDSGGVLSFTQDPTDSSLWIFESRDGGKWLDPAYEATIQLLWGGGSVSVSPDITVRGPTNTGELDRKAVVVRYGIV